MQLLKKRLLVAGVLAAVATLAAPARSNAAPVILVEEIDGFGNPVGTTTFTAPFGTNAGFFTTQHFTQVTVGASSNSGLMTNTASIATGVSALNTTAISAADADGFALRVTVTDIFTRPIGETTNVTSTAGAANGTTNLVGVNTVTNQTVVRADSSGPNLATTALAKAVSPSGENSGPQTATLGSLPSTFEIRQTIIMRITSGGETVPVGQSYSAAVGSATTPVGSPVPAPAGLVLALTALPVLGLRRVFRRKSAV